MMEDNERYILSTAKASVMRDVLALLFAAARSGDDSISGASPSLETCAKSGCDRMVLELLRPKEPPTGMSARVRNLRVSRLGRVLVVTGQATVPGILHDIDVVRRPRFFPEHLASGLFAPVRTLFHTLRLSSPQN